MITNTNFSLLNGTSETLALADDNNNIDNLKLFWKKAFIAKADEMFKNLGQAKFEQLFGVDNVQGFIDGVVPNLNGNLYNFNEYIYNVNW